MTHKPKKLRQSILCTANDVMTKKEKWNIYYKINCANCEKHYIGPSGRPLHLRLHENELAVKCRNISSLILVYVDNCGHSFNWKNMEILDIGNSKNIREFLEVWHSSYSLSRLKSIHFINQPRKLCANIRTRIKPMGDTSKTMK